MASPLTFRMPRAAVKGLMAIHVRYIEEYHTRLSGVAVPCFMFICEPKSSNFSVPLGSIRERKDHYLIREGASVRIRYNPDGTASIQDIEKGTRVDFDTGCPWPVKELWTPDALTVATIAKERKAAQERVTELVKTSRPVYYTYVIAGDFARRIADILAVTTKCFPGFSSLAKLWSDYSTSNAPEKQPDLNYYCTEDAFVINYAAFTALLTSSGDNVLFTATFEHSVCKIPLFQGYRWAFDAGKATPRHAANWGAQQAEDCVTTFTRNPSLDTLGVVLDAMMNRWATAMRDHYLSGAPQSEDAVKHIGGLVTDVDLLARCFKTVKAHVVALALEGLETQLRGLDWTLPIAERQHVFN